MNVIKNYTGQQLHEHVHLTIESNSELLVIFVIITSCSWTLAGHFDVFTGPCVDKLKKSVKLSICVIVLLVFYWPFTG